MLEAAFLGGTADQDIIKEKKDKMVEEGVVNLIHETMKSGWGITEVEAHGQGLITTLMSAESCFGYIFPFLPDLMVART